MGDISPFAANRLRISLFVFACALAALAAWMLMAELLRPKGIKFTTDAQLAASNYVQREAALRAARAGLVRGDLWSEAAFAYGSNLWSDSDNGSSSDAPPFDRIKALSELAITLAPHDCRLWLLFAANYFRFDWLNERAASSLRMSFYTGPNSIAVVPGRLLLATQSRALQDDDFQALVRHDIQLALTHRSELMPALISAYNKAPFESRQFIEKALAELDASVLATLRAEKNHQ